MDIASGIFFGVNTLIASVTVVAKVVEKVIDRCRARNALPEVHKFTHEKAVIAWALLKEDFKARGIVFADEGSFEETYTQLCPKQLVDALKDINHSDAALYLAIQTFNTAADHCLDTIGYAIEKGKDFVFYGGGKKTELDEQQRLDVFKTIHKLVRPNAPMDFPDEKATQKATQKAVEKAANRYRKNWGAWSNLEVVDCYNVINLNTQILQLTRQANETRVLNNERIEELKKEILKEKEEREKVMHKQKEEAEKRAREDKEELKKALAEFETLKKTVIEAHLMSEVSSSTQLKLLQECEQWKRKYIELLEKNNEDNKRWVILVEKAYKIPESNKQMDHPGK